MAKIRGTMPYPRREHERVPRPLEVRPEHEPTREVHRAHHKATFRAPAAEERADVAEEMHDVIFAVKRLLGRADTRSHARALKCADRLELLRHVATDDLERARIGDDQDPRQPNTPS
jgi:hypothetical protein